MENQGLRGIVERRLAELGLGPVEAATRGGLERSFIRDILHDKKKSVRGDNLNKLGAALDLDPGELARGNAVPIELKANGNGPHPSARMTAPATGGMVNEIPVLGTAAGSTIDRFRIGAPVDSVARPPGLAGARGIYAIFVARSSMEPEHRPGDLRYVNPHRPVKVGDSVVVKLQHYGEGEEEALIAHYVGEDEKHVVVRKLNPAATVKLDRKSVISVHKVLTTNELMGV